MTPTYFYGFSDSILEVVLHEPSDRGVPEALVHDVWRHQRFRTSGLETFGGVPVTILDPGEPNTDAGPDFLGTRLRLGSTSWTGAVEIHTASGVWQDHGHERDPRYNSTLLHVVLYHDIWTGKLRREDGTLLPELVLFPHLDAPLRRLIHSFYTRSDGRILCAAGWGRVPESERTPYLEKLAEERISSKAVRFRHANNRETSIYEQVFAGLGYSKNSGAMQTLTRIVSLDTVRSVDDTADIEALYLGASGLLPAPSDLLEADRATADYVMDLRDRFDRLNFRLEIEPMPPTAWRFFRLRPANFPPLRIAQAAALLRSGGFLRDDPLDQISTALRSKTPVRSLRALFDVHLSAFWTEHVRLERRTSRRNPAIGRHRTDALLVNVIAPALLSLDADSAGSITELLAGLPYTDDEVTRQFSRIGTTAASALHAQGLHQLYRTRCAEARCLSCSIGRFLLHSDVVEDVPASIARPSFVTGMPADQAGATK